MNYGELAQNKNNKEYIEEFFKKIYTNEIKDKDLLKYFTVEELKNLLFDDVLGNYFQVYYENSCFEYVCIFKDSSLDIAYQLNNKDILKYCFSYYASAYKKITKFLEIHPDTYVYLLEGNNLNDFFTYRKKYNCFLDLLPIDFVEQNIDYICYIISCHFSDKADILFQEIDEIGDISISLGNLISYYQCGERKELLCFLNEYQKHYDVNLELYRKEILEILFSHEYMKDRKENPYLESLEMVLDEVLQVQNLTINDIKYLTHGCFSDIYQIGDFVLKLGDRRHILKIPSHRNVLRPIFRRYLEEIHLMVEIAPKAFALGERDSKASQILFDFFYKDKIIFGDLQPANVGKYHSIIDKYFKGIYISNESIGFLGDSYDEPEEDEYVLIDSDHLEYEASCNIEEYVGKEYIYKYIKEYKRRNK